jgi:serine kinase of HPr protein (carbohydrate metabolism regulator)
MTDRPSAPNALSLHASCIIIGESGVLIMGASGHGKSQLAIKLMHRARQQNRFAALVSDDRTLVSVLHGQNGDHLIARPHPDVAGLIERRGSGLIKTTHEACARIDLVIDLQKEAAARMPEPESQTISLAGLSRPRILCSLACDDPAVVALGLDLWAETVIT